MQLQGAVLIAFLTVAPLSAQLWPAGGFGTVVFPAGRPAPGVNPWGNVVTPAIPQGAAALATGVRYAVPSAGRTANGAGSGHRRSGTGSIYAYPVFVGGYSYGYGNGSTDPQAANNSAPDQPSQPSQAPVVINQYFNSPPPGQGSSVDTSARGSDTQTPPGDAPYYLLAFKDHTVYSAVAYYTEGDTLHYFTEGNVHNQASLSLVDRPLTEELNRARNVEVHLP